MKAIEELFVLFSSVLEASYRLILSFPTSQTDVVLRYGMWRMGLSSDKYLASLISTLL